MKTILHNGKFYLNEGCFAEAVLIDGGIIEAVGTNDQIVALAPDAEKHDLLGKTALPGFIDSHMHLYNVGIIRGNIMLNNAASLAEIKDRTLAFINEHNPEKGTVLFGRGWNQDYFTGDKIMPTRHDLDAITTDYPLVFTRACGHVLIANTPAIEKAGVTRDTAQVEGGDFELDPDGSPNGIFKENAQDLISGALELEPTIDDLKETLKSAMAYAAQNGITSVQTNDLYDEGAYPMYTAYDQLAQEGNATVRAYLQCCFNSVEVYREFLSRGFVTGMGNDFRKIGPLKLFADGSLGARTALMRNDYADTPGTRGIRCIEPETLLEYVKLSKENNMQVAVHAIGDGAIEMVLDAYESVYPNGENPNRNAIIHCQITDEGILNRFAKNNISALVQPIFLHYDMHITSDRVGDDLAKTSYAFGTMDKLGIHNSYGSDSPVEDLNPFENIYCAVTRKDLKGYPEGGWNGGEAVSVGRAIDHYTIDSAYNSFEEDRKGRIEAGYFADIVVLSDDIFTIPQSDIKNLKAVMTMVDGKIVYEK